MKLRANTKYLVHINTIQDCYTWLHTPLYEARKKKPDALPLMILGGGSNLIFAENRQGIVIHNNVQGHTITKENKHYVDIEIQSGTHRDNMVRWAVKKGYSGIENLVSIPGTVGGAAIQNIGAYGQEISGSIRSISGIDLFSGKTKTLTQKQCLYSYRSSVFKQKQYRYFLINTVTLRLHKHDVENPFIPNTSYGSVQESLQDHTTIYPLNMAQAIERIRKTKLPDRKKVGTAGSFFKNPLITKEKAKDLQYQYLHDNLTKPMKKYHPHHPQLIQRLVDETKVKLAAGQLIELCGRKGYMYHGVGTYHKHALTLIHTGNAEAQTFIELVHAIQADVQKTFGIRLEPEVLIYTNAIGASSQIYGKHIESKR